MPREGAIIFGDLIGKLDLLRIECPKCGPGAPVWRRISPVSQSLKVS